MKNSKHTLLKETLQKTMREHKKLFIGMVLIIAAAIITSLLPPLVLEKIVNRLSDQENISLLLALSYFLFVLLADISESLQNALITIFGQKMTHGIRSALCAKLSRLPSQYFHTHQSGEIESLFTNDGDAIDVLYSDGIVTMFADTFKLIAIFIVIFTRSVGLGLLLAAVTPLLYLFTRWSQKHMSKAQLDNRKAIARVNSHVPETLRCMHMIHHYHAQKYMEDKYDTYIQESYEAVDRANIVDSIYSPVILIVQSAVIAVLMIFAAAGGSFRSFFGVSVGSAAALIAYVGKIFSPLENIGMEIQNIQAAGAALTHMEAFLNEPDWQPEGQPAVADENIHFDHVSFAYEADRPVLKDLSFTVKKGENVTFVGRTGTGKSTIFRLLTGLYEPDQGTVSVAGCSPAVMKKEDRRKVYGYVEQSFVPVLGTIRDQITLYDPSYTDEDVMHALKEVGMDEAVQNLPEGLDTPMNEKLFSKGQLQLLSIARAVVSSPAILLLDEITANLDAETEERVIRALQTSAEGRTVISISHRLSESIRASRIIEIG